MTDGIIIGVEGTPNVMRVLPHSEDPLLLMLKAVDPDVLRHFVDMLGVTPRSEIFQGGNFHMVAVKRTQFVQNIGKAFDLDISSSPVDSNLN